MYRSLTLLLLVMFPCVSSPAFAEEEAPRPIVAVASTPSDASLSFERINLEDGLRVHITQPIDLKQKGFWSITGYKLRIEKGTYSDPRRAKIGERELVLLPAKQYLDSRQTDVGGQDPWVALDLRTMEVVGRALNRIEQAARFAGPNGPRVSYKWIYGLTLMDGGEVVVDRFQRIAVSKEQQEARNRREYEAFVERAEAKKAEEKREADRTRADKRKIGARLCQTDGGIRLVGFTEAIGENRIQIRVSEAWEAWNPGAPRLPLTPYVVWENPDNWRYCD